MSSQTVILGAGITGIGTGFSSGYPIYEAKDHAGGICSSYYIRPLSREKLWQPPKDEEVYRFEIGGGHWIFNASPEIRAFLKKFESLKNYERKSAVYFPNDRRFIPYPLQNHLEGLNPQLTAKIKAELGARLPTRPGGRPVTLANWLRATFGPTLCKLFFLPYNHLYTDGLLERIAPQDLYKIPTSSANKKTKKPAVGYNPQYLYPRKGLDALVRRLCEKCSVHYRKQVTQIDTAEKVIHFSDRTQIAYRKIISTLPLNRMVELSNTKVPARKSPHTSVLVLNIGAIKGEKCPPFHWVYVIEKKLKFHRVGFYSNVDASFLPKSARKKQDRVSIYVERVYQGGKRPSAAEIDRYSQAVVRKLQQWKMIKTCEVLDPTWIDVAYTWNYPGSNWKDEAIKALEKKKIYQLGRYGRWHFQGIAESLKEGFDAGIQFKKMRRKRTRRRSR